VFYQHTKNEPIHSREKQYSREISFEFHTFHIEIMKENKNKEENIEYRTVKYKELKI
jgi:hypothetical protein